MLRLSLFWETMGLSLPYSCLCPHILFVWNHGRRLSPQMHMVRSTLRLSISVTRLSTKFVLKPAAAKRTFTPVLGKRRSHMLPVRAACELRDLCHWAPPQDVGDPLSEGSLKLKPRLLRASVFGTVYSTQFRFLNMVPSSSLSRSSRRRSSCT